MKIEDFILLIKSSELNAHFYHWSTTSYAIHKALEGYYEAIRDLIDEFVEVAQGKFGITYDFSTKQINISDLSLSTYFSELSHQAGIMVDYLLRDYKDLENIGLEIVAEINKLRYLLSLQ